MFYFEVDEGGEYKFKKIVKMVDNKFEIKQKGYLNLENTLKLLANLIWYKKS